MSSWSVERIVVTGVSLFVVKREAEVYKHYLFKVDAQKACDELNEKEKV